MEARPEQDGVRLPSRSRFTYDLGTIYLGRRALFPLFSLRYDHSHLTHSGIQNGPYVHYVDEKAVEVTKVGGKWTASTFT